MRTPSIKLFDSKDRVAGVGKYELDLYVSYQVGVYKES